MSTPAEQWERLQADGSDIALDSGQIVHVTWDVDVGKGNGRGRAFEAIFRAYFTIADGPCVFEFVSRAINLVGVDGDERADPGFSLLAHGHALYLDGRFYTSDDDGPAHHRKAAGQAALVVADLLAAVRWDRYKAEQDAIAAYRKGRKR